jgi:phospholipid/cholesterol/gamma-HCH transport system ATP-binding protein
MSDSPTNPELPGSNIPGPEIPGPDVPAEELPGSQDFSEEFGGIPPEILDMDKLAPSAPDREPIVFFKNVSISFNDRPILKDVSFAVDRGQTLCILGRSGVGKSVALRMLMGFLRPDSGSVHVEGKDITRMSEEEMRAIRKRVTMVFQNGALFDSMTVRENVAFPLREHGGLAEDQIQQIVERLISMVGAEDVQDALPASLSTGRKRAVAIARALASQPEVVLYDEPTTMVDPIIARRLGDLIQRLKRQLGFTSIVVTHDMRFAQRLADKVLFLHLGRAHYYGPLAGFLSSTDPQIRQFLALDAYILPEK